MEEFKAICGMRRGYVIADFIWDVYIDMLNHTSIAHPWDIRGRHGRSTSKWIFTGYPWLAGKHQGHGRFQIFD